ncbi:hypothetical protein C3L33_03438, partial [Rhododendron williamsianum]
MDLQDNVQREYGRFEQIVSHFLSKSLHIILDSRVPSIFPNGHNPLLGTPVKKSDKWFTLILGDGPACLENLSLWHRNLTEPMIIDIVLVQEVPDSSSGHNPTITFGLGMYVETLIERWVVQYEDSRTVFPRVVESSCSDKKTYKKSIILLRSLYSLMRLLPAYNPSRSCVHQLELQILISVTRFIYMVSIDEVDAFSSKWCNLLSGTPVKKSDKWFSLKLGDRPASLDNLNLWHRNLTEPMIIDILLVQEVPDSSSDNNPTTTLGLGKYVETVIERWVVQYEYSRTVFPHVVESSSSYKKTYKKSIILLRSLYAMMRLLPAYRPFRKLCSSTQASDFDINYKVSSFSAPFSREEEEVMKPYNFASVDAPQGRLSISVTYCENLSCFNLDTSIAYPPQIITDYVGSPATDPFRAFPSEKGFSATSFSLRGVQSPSSTPFQRPHSWTSGLHRMSPLMQPLGDLHPSATHHKSTSFDEHQLSPPFSPSPSPSPPTYLSGGNPVKVRRHSETAPMSIPHPMMGRSPRYLSPNLSDPNRHSLPPLSPRSTKFDASSQDSSSGIRLPRRSESLRGGESHSGMSNLFSGQKGLRDSKDDSGRFSGLLSSSDSPRIGFSRSSSKLSFQDDFDDFDFSGPFIVDDVDTSDSPVVLSDLQHKFSFFLTYSQNLDGKRSSEFTKSQDAAVGALVHMLRTAPPLRQDSSCYSSHSSKTELEGEVGAISSGFFLPRKTSDALEELRSYKDMKDLLLSKSGTHVVFIATCMNREVLLREAGASQDLLHPTCLDSKIVCELLQFPSFRSFITSTADDVSTEQLNKCDLAAQTIFVSLSFSDYTLLNPSHQSVPFSWIIESQLKGQGGRLSGPTRATFDPASICKSYQGRDRQLNWAFGNSISTLITSGCKYSGVSGFIVSFRVKGFECRVFTLMAEITVSPPPQ